MVANTFDVATTALSAGVVVIIGSIPVLAKWLVNVGARVATLERETPAAFVVVNQNIATLAESVEKGRLENDKRHTDLATNVNDIKLTLAEMKGRAGHGEKQS